MTNSTLSHYFRKKLGMKWSMPGSTEAMGIDDAVLLSLEYTFFYQCIFIFIASFFFLPNAVYASTSCQSFQTL